jgi:hypothetical protein
MILLLLSSCQKDTSSEIVEPPDHQAVITFKGLVDDEALEFGKNYQNSFGEPYSVRTLKFYVHGIELKDTRSGYLYQADNSIYYLINFSDPDGVNLHLTVPAHQYDQLNFVVGVDSIFNVSGAQTGALDPAYGMFWTWNSGYIMAKLEGNSPLANTANNAFEYHIGGFKEKENVIKKISLIFPSEISWDLQPGSTTEVNIGANINSWFSGAHPVRLSEHPVCTTPGNLSLQIAENYSRMFSVTEVINQP